MGLDDVRKRLPLVDQLPRSRGRGYAPQEFSDAHRPAYAVWEFTSACDQACQACGPRSGKARPDELNTDEALRLVEEMRDLGVGEVTLIGGEAYLRPDFILIIRAIREAGMKATMTTGGRALDRRRAEAMVEAGIELVSVSIDGLGATHDRLRRTEGGFDKAIQALRHVRAAGAKIGVNTQVNRGSKGELLQLGEQIADLGIVVWQVFLTVPHGNATENLDLVLQPYELIEVYAELESVLDLCDRRNIVFYGGNTLGYFGPLEHRIRKMAPEQRYPGCQAGRAAVGITSNGSIKSCPTLGGSQNTGGSWRDQPLRDLWHGAPEIRYAGRRTEDVLWGYCKRCYYAKACMGGCTAMGEAVMGRPGNNPYCHHRALEMDREGLRERIELVDAAVDEPFGLARFRLIIESTDPRRRAADGPVSVEEARTSRAVEPNGPGTPLG